MIRNTGASFFAVRVNESTFAITEDDSWEERPIVYAKVLKDLPLIILSDTGCNSPSERSKNARITHLRDFLENFPIPENDNKPINPAARKRYCLIMMHCHFDHIGGIDQFQDATIVASAAGKDFVTSDVWEHSLCKLVGLPKPNYRPNLWVKDGDELGYQLDKGLVCESFPSNSAIMPLGITILNTPGHTPDELAWYDQSERHLYVGDSFYEKSKEDGFPCAYAGPIVFPKEGNWVQYMHSMRSLLDFVREEQRLHGDQPPVMVGSAHVSTSEPAISSIEGVIDTFEKIISGKTKAYMTDVTRGEEYSNWAEKGSKYRVRAPTRLVDEYRKHHNVACSLDWPSHLPKRIKPGTVIP